MYASLKEWVRFPFTFRRIQGRTASGDKKYSEPTEALCYRVDETEVITDKRGDEYVSRSRLYVDATTEISVDDFVTLTTLGENIIDKEVRKIGAFYDGNEGEKSISVVYL